MANRTTYTQARATLASLCNLVAETREPYVIERRNGENVALISEAELNALLETAHLVRSPRNAARLVSALERASQGKPAPASITALRRSVGLEKKKV
jgi:antitoxin YefM